MSSKPVAIEYNESLKPFEELLSGVKRPGDFFMTGRIEIPMPKLEVDGAGTASFPIPEDQVKRFISVAVQAPYGRGEETIVDTSVRRVWQVEADRVRISGKSWPSSLQSIVVSVAEGLGCAPAEIEAELYKLLVYDKGSFFKVHRDTEKAHGMFGTLIVVLPSEHEGGELLIRRAGREASLDLSGGEVSELTFAAFYADCEHEILPIVKGNRVCLVYNLIQRAGRTTRKPLSAPLYESETDAAAELLKQAWTPSAPAKIAWLLEHPCSNRYLAPGSHIGSLAPRRAMRSHSVSGGMRRTL